MAINLSTVWQKKFDIESCYTPFGHKILAYPKVVKHRRVPLWKFMVPWYKQTSTENSDITFSCKKCFDMSEISKTLNWSPMETFSTVKQTYFDRKSCCTLFVHKTFWYQKVVEHRIVPLRSFSVLWDKKFPIENRDNPPFLRRIFWYPRLPETQKGSPTKFFGTGRQKNFDRTRDISSLMQKFFKISKNSNFLNGSPMAPFSTMRQKIFDGELCFTAPVHRSLRYPKVVKHRRVPLRSPSLQWDKNFW